ncbi:MAG: hypothetical protein JWR26_2679 [Pedosphaera sp.]|nr:hypothetical protein [Pedosphaera sp.]
MLHRGMMLIFRLQSPSRRIRSKSGMAMMRFLYMKKALGCNVCFEWCFD